MGKDEEFWWQGAGSWPGSMLPFGCLGAEVPVLHGLLPGLGERGACPIAPLHPPASCPLLPLQKGTGEGTVRGPRACKSLFQIPAVYQVMRPGEPNGSGRWVIAVRALALPREPDACLHHSSRARLPWLTRGCDAPGMSSQRAGGIVPFGRGVGLGGNLSGSRVGGFAWHLSVGVTQGSEPSESVLAAQHRVGHECQGVSQLLHPSCQQ